MWEIISIIGALIINFCTPKISNCKIVDTNDSSTIVNYGFPFQYFEGEILTDKQVKYRFKIIYLNSMIVITFGSSGLTTVGPIIHQVGLPLMLPSNSIELVIQGNQNQQIYSVINDIAKELKLTVSETKKLQIISQEYLLGRITPEAAILKLRGGGDGWLDAGVILGFVILVNWLDSGSGSFISNAPPLPHMDPFGWKNGKYHSRPGVSYQSSKFELEMNGVNEDMCPGLKMKDENGFVMSYRDAYNLVAETYPGIFEIDENCKISDWQAAKHMYHAIGMGVNIESYGFTQKQLNLIQNEKGYDGGGLIAYARRGHKLPPIEMVRDYQLRLKNKCQSAPIKKADIPYYDKNGAWKSRVFAIPPTDDSSGIIIAFNQTTGEFITGDKQRLGKFKTFENEGYLGGKKWIKQWTQK